MLTRSGAKLLDFNIASRVGDPVHTLSGTPPYQPPDADLTRWDVSTDLFAVGVTLYELLCDGQHPYPGSQADGGRAGDRPEDRPLRPGSGSLAEFLRQGMRPVSKRALRHSAGNAGRASCPPSSRKVSRAGCITAFSDYGSLSTYTY